MRVDSMYPRNVHLLMNLLVFLPVSLLTEFGEIGVEGPELFERSFVLRQSGCRESRAA